MNAILPSLRSRAASFVDVLRERGEREAGRDGFVFLRYSSAGRREEERLTYGAMLARSRSVAAAMRSLCRRGDRALILAPPGLDYIAGFLGCGLAGVVAVPAYPRANAKHMERLLAIVEDCSAAVVLATAELAPRLAQWGSDRLPPVIALDALPGDVGPDWRDETVGGTDLAFLQYTSGTTGTPKGVMVGHDNLMANMLGWKDLRLRRDDVLLSWLPPYHDFGLICGILQPLLHGCLHVSMAPASFMQVPKRWLHAIADYRATVTLAPNFAYELACQAPQDETFDLSSLRHALSGGEPPRTATQQRFLRRFASHGFRAEMFGPGYGLAETTLQVTFPRIGRPASAIAPPSTRGSRLGEPVRTWPFDTAPAAANVVSNGPAIAGHDLRIVDPETCVERPAGEPGEVWVCGPTITRGYWGRPRQTAETFQARLANDPAAGPFLRTGDLGTLVEGELYVLGRIKELIIVRGRNHYAQDLEATVATSHPSLEFDSTIAFGFEQDGEEKLGIVYGLGRTAMRTLDASGLIAAIRRAVVETHEVVPHAIVLVRPATLPRTTSGKLQRLKTRELFLAGELSVVASWTAPSATDAAAQTRADGLRWQVMTTPPAQRAALLRRALAGRVRTALGLADPPGDLLGFADMGIDSLKAVQLGNLLSTELELEPPLPETVLFDQPNIAALASLIGARLGLAAQSPDEASKSIAGSASAADAAIAVVGMAARVPGAPDAAAFWELLRSGGDAIGEVPRERFDVDAWYDRNPEAAGKIYTRRGGFLDRVDLFDASFFGISPREAASMDPAQRLLLETAWTALEDAGIAPDRLRGSCTGVYVGVAPSEYGMLLGAGGDAALDTYFGTGTSPSVIAGRISFALGLEGPALAIDTACSSSLVAVHQACQALRHGECDAALAGGVNLILGVQGMLATCRARMLSADGRCKTFDASADGYGRGEGVAVIVLKRLADAECDGDRVLAVIRGSAVNQDGASGGLTVPSGSAQEKVIAAALAQADIAPADVSYLECHGTGTALGDPIEVQAAAKALGVDRPADRPLLLGSAKPTIGHLEAAAGIAGLVKVVLAMRAGELPAQAHFDTPNPRIPWSQLPVTVVSRHRAWPEGRRIAGVSSFGFSGTNAHVVLEGLVQPSGTAPVEDRPVHLVPLSAKTDAALVALVGRYAARLDDAEATLGDIAFTAAVGRSHFPHRAAVLARSREDLSAALNALASGGTHPSLRIGARRGPPKVAVLFTGQGSQWAGMGRELYRHEPVFRSVLDRCAAAVDALGLLAHPLLEVMFAEPRTERAALLDDTSYAQPALYALECGLWSLWGSLGLTAEAVLGHSVGEYAAAYAAGVFGLEDGARLVARRGALMGALPAGGAMAAVFAPAPAVSTALARGDAAALSLAADNGTHCVVSGPAAELESLLAGFAESGVRCQRLTVSHAFHSALLEPMLPALQAAAESVGHRPAQLTLVSNLTGAVFAAGAGPDASYWSRHAREPVGFAASVATLAALGADLLLEIGPRGVLGPLARGCWPQQPAPVVVSPSRADELAFIDSLADLYAAGGPVDFAAWHRDRAGRRIALPCYPFMGKRFWPDRSLRPRIASMAAERPAEAIEVSANVPAIVAVEPAPESLPMTRQSSSVASASWRTLPLGEAPGVAAGARVLHVPPTLTAESMQSLEQQIRDCNQLVVLRDQPGSEHFCLGFDLGRQGFGNAEASEGLLRFADFAERLTSLSMPIICVVSGNCRGGGMLFPSAASIVLATSTATFGFPEIRRGALPGVVSVAARRRLSAADCEWLMLTGDRIDAATAQRLGLVNFIGSAEEVERELDRLLRTFKGIDPDLLSACRTECPAPDKASSLVTMGRFGRSSVKASSHDLVRVTHDPALGVAAITLADPAHGNGLDLPIARDLQRAIRATRAIDGLGAVVLEGDGSHFCIGANPYRAVDSATRNTTLGNASTIFEIYEALVALRDLSVPTICAVHGKVVGGGLALMLNADHRIAAADATFNLGNLPRGYCPGGLLSENLQRVVGPRWAMELYLNDYTLTAQEALAIGLVNEVQADAEAARRAARDAAVRIASAPRTAVTEAVSLLRPAVDRARLARESLGLARASVSIGRAVKSWQADPRPAPALPMLAKLGSVPAGSAVTSVARPAVPPSPSPPVEAISRPGDDAGPDRARDVGIVAMELYVPDHMARQSDMERFHSAEGKYTIGLSQQSIAMCGGDEDPVSMALTVVHRLLERHGIGWDRIGRLEVGTESQVDRSKSIKSYLMQLFEAQGNCAIEGVDTYNACYGGTAALLNTVAWCQSEAWDGRYGLVVCTDIADMDADHAFLGGAAAVAVLVGPDAALAMLPERATHMLHRWDFYKPMGWKDPFPIVRDGRHSIDVYLECLAKCHETLTRRLGSGLLQTDGHFVFHSPHAYLIQLGFRRLVELEAPGLSRQDQHALYQARVEPGTRLLRQIGSCYTASVFVGLYSLLLEAGPRMIGETMTVYSYGSGASASLYRFKVHRMPLIDDAVPARMAKRHACDVPAFLALTRSYVAGHGRFDYEPSVSGPRQDGTYYLARVDAWGQRFYRRHEQASSGVPLGEAEAMLPAMTAAGPCTPTERRVPRPTRAAVGREGLLDWLSQQVQQVLHLDGPPAPDEVLAHFGMDSLMAVELRDRINQELELDPPLSATVMFEQPNLATLSAEIEARLGVVAERADSLSEATSGHASASVATPDPSASAPMPILVEPAPVIETMAAVEPVMAADAVAAVVERPAPAAVAADPWAVNAEERRLWLLDGAAGGDPALLISTAVTLSSELDAPALDRAVAAVLAANPALRQIFPTGPDGPVRAPLLALPQPLVGWIDLSQEAACAEDLDEVLRDVTRAPMNLQSGPLFRFLAIRSKPDEVVLSVTLHHIVGDLRSLNVVVNAVVRELVAGCDGVPTAAIVPAEPSSDRAPRAEEPAPLMPAVNEAADLRTFCRTATIQVEIPEPLTSELSTFLQSPGVSTGSVLLAAWRCLFSRLAEGRSVPIFVPIDESMPAARNTASFSAFPRLFEAAVDPTSSFQGIIGETGAHLLELKRAPATSAPEQTAAGMAGMRQRPAIQVSVGTVFDLPQGLDGGHVTSLLPTMGAYGDHELQIAMMQVLATRRHLVLVRYNAERLDHGSARALLDAYFEMLAALIRQPAIPIEKASPALDVPPFAHWKGRRLRLVSSFSDALVRDEIGRWADRLDMAATIESADYAQVLQELLDPESGTRRNRNGATILFLRTEDLLRERSDLSVLLGSAERFEAALTPLVDEWGDAIVTAGAVAGRTPLLVVLCPASDRIARDTGLAAVSRLVAESLVARLSTAPGVVVLDAAAAAVPFGPVVWNDAESDRMAHLPFTAAGSAVLAAVVVRRLHEEVRRPCKVVVVDCDNTLWQGVAGEDGPAGIVLTEGHLALQRRLVEAAQSGLLVCLCSKNAEADVHAVFAGRPEMPLRREHLAAERINWLPKAQNIADLASTLSLGLDSFVLLDDNPAEIAAVRAALPEVTAITVPGSDALSRFVGHLWLLDRSRITREDVRRTAMYREEGVRGQLRQQAESWSSFLAGLRLEIEARAPRDGDVDRIAQLTLRTNQFNVRPRPWADAEIRAACGDPAWLIRLLEVRDRFGDYGTVGLIAARVVDGVLCVEQFLMSCRVLGRGVEQRMISLLGAMAAEAGASHAVLDAVRTSRNQPVWRLLERLPADRQQDGDSTRLEIAADAARGVALSAEQAEADVSAYEAARNHGGQAGARFSPCLAPPLPGRVWERVAGRLATPAALGRRTPAQPEAAAWALPRPAGGRTDGDPSSLRRVVSQVFPGAEPAWNEPLMNAGVSSLDIARLLAAIRRELGADIGFRHLRRQTSLADLAAVLSGEANSGASAASGALPDEGAKLMAEDLVLPRSIVPAGQGRAERQGPPQRILLTGATGFLGSYLAAELLERSDARITCLVRAASDAEAATRLRMALAGSGRPDAAAAVGRRLRAIAGQLEVPEFGLGAKRFADLAAATDAILHNAAQVDFLAPYAALRAANVEGTRQILALAARGANVHVHYVSSVAVFDTEELSGVERVMEPELPERANGHFHGYAQSKWVAERNMLAARSRGMAVTIHRPGNITGDSVSGYWPAGDAFTRTLRLCIRVGAVPDLQLALDMTPVDHVAAAIATLVAAGEGAGSILHLVAPERARLEGLTDWMTAAGMGVERVPMAEWSERVSVFVLDAADDPAAAVAPMLLQPVADTGSSFMEFAASRLRFDDSEARRLLAPHGLRCPVVDGEIFARYLARLGATGFLPAAEATRSRSLASVDA